ncbi:MAG: MiaB/RimO family radical SAM methylthiotransferase [Bacteroidales bacterium]|nr:MiaB/RimO family radical SAM methylthiotransferase [Bacteroidales bacterium]MDD4740238.1 MiaB/RimO family radical SAM methylthiotransferase [Bacteroidales bacterium]
MKYHLITLGCQMNMSDSERVRTIIETQTGYQWTDHEEEANLVGILACSVRQKAIDKVYSRITRWNKWKSRRNLITFISGCILPADMEKFLKLFDIVFRMSELEKLPEMIRHYGVVTPASLFGDLKRMPSNDSIDDFWRITPHYSSDFEAFVPIQNGCDKFCTFCAVPYTRGREVSRPSAEIIQEAQQLVEQGYKSITLLGQNVNSYGLDKKGEELSFPQLLEAIGKMGEDSEREFWVYFTSPHPRDMTDEVVEMVARYRCLARQFHLPVQSGDDMVLIHMNRKHTVDKYRQIIHAVRRIIPEATIFTDIITGFSGETEEQHTNTRLMMEEFKYNMAYIAQYSPRPGAASSRWADDIAPDIKRRRYHELSNDLRKHALVHNTDMVGKSYRVLVTGHDRKPGFLSALTEGKIVCRFAALDEKLIGTFTDIVITSATDFSVEGERVAVAELTTGN